MLPTLTPGTRIEVVKLDDPYTSLRPGSRGTVTHVRMALDITQISVRWDDGSTLMLLDGHDEWRIVT